MNVDSNKVATYFNKINKYFNKIYLLNMAEVSLKKSSLIRHRKKHKHERITGTVTFTTITKKDFDFS